MARPPKANDFETTTEPKKGEDTESSLRKLLRLQRNGDATLVSSAAYEASHVLKDGPGILLSLSGYNSKNASQFIQLIDAPAVPGDSAVAEIFTVDLAAKTPAGLSGKYFTCADADGPVFVWFDLDNASTAPNPGGRGIEVDIATGDSAAQMATKLAAALEADASYTAAAVDTVVTVENSATGDRTNAAAGTSTATVATTQAGNTVRVPKMSRVVATVANFEFPIPPGGLPFEFGIVVCNSSTGPAKTLGGNDCFFTALVR